jgi:hypothetical protein
VLRLLDYVYRCPAGIGKQREGNSLPGGITELTFAGERKYSYIVLQVGAGGGGGWPQFC